MVQTFTDFELILVDDGSPDTCPEICDEYAAMDPRVTVIHKPNGGVSSARNTGMAEAKGKYIMFCDSDDKVEASWCQSMYDVIEKNPNSWVVSNVWRVDRSGRTQPIDMEMISSDDFQSGLTYFQIYKKSLSAYSWNKIYELKKIQNFHILFPQDREIGEDVLFNIQYYQHCNSAVYVQNPLYYYYDTESGAMNQYRNDLFELNLPLFDARLPLILQSELRDFCDIYFYYFLNWLVNTFDQRNKISFLKKMRYNQKMMKTEEFRFCIAHMTGKNDSPIFIQVVRTHNFYLYWLFQKATQIKARLSLK